MIVWIFHKELECKVENRSHMKLEVMQLQPRSQGSLLPALRSVGQVGENPGNEVDAAEDNLNFQYMIKPNEVLQSWLINNDFCLFKNKEGEEDGGWREKRRAY